VKLEEEVQLLHYSLEELKTRTKLPIPTLISIQQHLSRKYLLTETIISDSDSKLSTGDKGIDLLLNGGLIKGQITEIYGESGTGKSTFAMQLCYQSLLPIQLGGLGGGSLIISTSKYPSIKKLEDLFYSFSSKYGVDDSVDSMHEWMDQIYIAEVRDFDTILHLMKYHFPQFMLNKGLKLLIVDSIAGNFRGTDDGIAYEITTRSGFIFNVCQMAHDLCSRHQIVGVFVNEVSANFHHKVYVGSSTQGKLFSSAFTGDSYDVLPALGNSLANCINSRIYLERKNGKRRMEIIFCPDAELGSLEISIDQNGIKSTDLNDTQMDIID
jgi:hypothetical protein